MRCCNMRGGGKVEYVGLPNHIPQRLSVKNGFGATIFNQPILHTILDLTEAFTGANDGEGCAEGKQSDEGVGGTFR
jgi:hypothetical protein